MTELRFRCPLDQIGYVRMIVEAYDGLAVMSSQPGSELVTWQVAPGREAEATALGRALETETGMRPLG